MKNKLNVTLYLTQTITQYENSQMISAYTIMMIIMRPNPADHYQELCNKDSSRQEIVHSLQQQASQWATEKREKKAIECLDYAMQTLETATCDTEKPILAKLYHQVGHLWRQLGNNKLTGIYYKKALALYQNIYAKKAHYDVAAAHFVLASFLDQLWKKKPAQFHYELALSLMTQLTGNYEKEIAIITQKIADIKTKKPTSTSL